mmetsp:Transcript_65114/g.152430  ORF Transcript_65114/g.152430 Transcript_65114/m.152430 type:complete len:84 (-) Transcript_65114:74-325(-)
MLIDRVLQAATEQVRGWSQLPFGIGQKCEHWSTRLRFVTNAQNYILWPGLHWGWHQQDRNSVANLIIGSILPIALVASEVTGS